MFSATHKQIAAKVFEELKSELDVVLDYDSLLFGSIAPDIYPSMLLMSHWKEGSIDLVHKHIDWLTANMLPDSSKSMEKFSFRLGIVIHFISDYFCKAHNEKRYNNLLIHFVYENKLRIYFEKRLKESTNSDIIKVTNWKMITDIKDYIEIKIKEYNSLKRSLINDFTYSLNVSTAVALSILAICMANSNEDRSIKEFGEELRTA